MLTLDKHNIINQLEQGFLIQNHQFHPRYFILQVDDPEFGCEGRPEGETIYGQITLLSLKGTFVLQVEEPFLWKSGIDDRMWIGRLDGTEGIIMKREIRDAYAIMEPKDYEYMNQIYEEMSHR
ncbi:hypothetical protein lbkm_0494 [Lachnospiraceae bacterium KM106-2]|nr:hypothetical protein lbkm_0494 [Lachnospiraceae bacterium KM106-2]